jgi:hypothetical protein
MFSSVAIHPGLVRSVVLYPAAWKKRISCRKMLEPMHTICFSFFVFLLSLHTVKQLNPCLSKALV